MKKLLPMAAAAVALCAAQPAALAATQIGEYLSFSGFGTLGRVQTDSNEGKYGRDLQVGGANRKASYDVDSNLGLQLTGTATPWLSGTVQVLASKRDKGHIEPDLEWAFVNVKPLDGLNLRGGKMAAPVFAISDSRNVGFANNWVRAPNEVYGLNVFSTMTAVDATYRTTLGPVSLSGTGFAGKSEFVLTSLGGAKADVKSLKGLNLLIETDWVNVRVGKMQGTVVIPALGETGDRYTFSGVGLMVDRDNIVAQAEYVQRRSAGKPDAVNADGWYVMGGYRFGGVLPYVIRSSTSPKVPKSPVLVTGTQKTTALGVRWDALSSASLKFQVDRVDTSDTRGISFTTPTTPPPFPGVPPGSKPVLSTVNVYSLAVDFTF